MSNCCCIKTLNLCNVSVCGSLEIAKSVTGDSGESGEISYSLVLDFLETQIYLNQAQTIGENIIFDISSLNENFQYTGQIFDSNGNLVSILFDGLEYDCIKFKTIMSMSANPVVGETDSLPVLTGCPEDEEMFLVSI